MQGNFRRILPGVLTAAAAVLLRVLARAVPGFADAYSDTMNPILVNTLGRISGAFPFSVEEFMILFLLPFLLYLWKKRALSRTLVFLVPFFFLLFELNEDIYFSRTGFAAKAGMTSSDYTTEELEEICLLLTDEVNETAPLVLRDEAGLMTVSPGLPGRMQEAMERLGQTYPILSGYYPRPKPVLFSVVLSRCGFTGFYSMIPVEANYNREMPPYNIPFTIGHELSHLKGITSEQEANFIGFLSCFRASDPDLRYSGAMLGWIYCSNELYRRDPKRHRALRKRLSEDALRDLDHNSAFWDRNEGKIKDTAESLNDSFLKSEGLPEGVRSYDLVVDLIVHYLQRSTL